MVSKFQHLVIYVTNLTRSKYFYMQLFDLQFSALNHPDSSAAMRLSHQEMHFFSFGYYHHDLCLVKHHRLRMDNNSMLHYTLVLRDKYAFDKIEQKAEAMGIPLRRGRFLASALMHDGWRAFSVRDPDRHWIEILLK